MKHRIPPFLVFVLLIATATAQGEWKWAHYWSGQDGTTTSTSYHNYISNSAFDDEGNLYVYGAMEDNPVMDGEPSEFCLEAMYGGQNNPATYRITIESEEGFPIKSVAVTDMQGQLITVLPCSDVRHTLNIHKLPAGTYIAHIETKAGISDVKFVKGE